MPRIALAVLGPLLGLLVMSVGVYGYSFLARSNVRVAPNVPWAPLLALPLLWLYWRYLGGWGWPRGSSAYRARMRRAHPVVRADRTRVAAAALAGLVFVLAAMTLAFRLTDLPADALRLLPADSPVPWWTAGSLLVVLALTAGIAEEVGLRGYAQRALEEASTPGIAIVVPAILFTLLHADKLWFIQQAVPMLIAAVWYGYLTFVTQSIYPMVIVHTAIDLVLFIAYSMLALPAPTPVSSSGYDATFWVTAAIALSAGIVAFALTSALRRAPRSIARAESAT